MKVAKDFTGLRFNRKQIAWEIWKNGQCVSSMSVPKDQSFRGALSYTIKVALKVYGLNDDDLKFKELDKKYRFFVV